MWDHSTDSSVKDARGSSKVKGTSFGIDNAALSQEGHVLDFVSEKGT
jgi:hypothetical protein